jgi:hypothetical protein
MGKQGFHTIHGFTPTYCQTNVLDLIKANLCANRGSSSGGAATRISAIKEQLKDQVINYIKTYGRNPPPPKIITSPCTGQIYIIPI